MNEFIRDQTKAIKESDEDEDGQEDNVGYMRSLYRILTLPVGDIKSIRKHKKGLTFKKTWGRKFNIWCTFRKKIGIYDVPKGDCNGYKPITRKSLFFHSPCYKNCLMDLVLMCQELSISAFVGD